MYFLDAEGDSVRYKWVVGLCFFVDMDGWIVSKWNFINNTP